MTATAAAAAAAPTGRLLLLAVGQEALDWLQVEDGIVLFENDSDTCITEINYCGIWEVVFCPCVVAFLLVAVESGKRVARV